MPISANASQHKTKWATTSLHETMKPLKVENANLGVHCAACKRPCSWGPAGRAATGLFPCPLPLSDVQPSSIAAARANIGKRPRPLSAPPKRKERAAFLSASVSITYFFSTASSGFPRRYLFAGHNDNREREKERRCGGALFLHAPH